MRDIRSALDDLLGVLEPGHSLILRSTIAPGHDRVRRRLPAQAPRLRDRRGGVRLARAGADRRRAASSPRSTRCPASSAASARAPGRSRPSCSASSTRRSCRRRPSQAELAKIWANILRYTNFALPNLLMMDCERAGANVFEVIDLINRDYPRGGIAQPGFTAGTCLRKDFTFSEERSAAPGMLLAVSRVNESVPLFLVEGIKRRLGLARGPPRGGARARLQGRHRRRARLARAQAGQAAGARARRRRDARPARRNADGAAAGGARGSRRRGRGRQPLRLPRPGDARRDRRARRAELPGRRPLGLLGRRAGLRLRLGAGRARRRRAGAPVPEGPPR